MAIPITYTTCLRRALTTSLTSLHLRGILEKAKAFQVIMLPCQHWKEVRFRKPILLFTPNLHFRVNSLFLQNVLWFAYFHLFLSGSILLANTPFFPAVLQLTGRMV